LHITTRDVERIRFAFSGHFFRQPFARRKM
jgi:hypothetical protein